MGGRRTARVAALTLVVLSGSACFASKTDVERLRAEVNSVHDETLLVDSVRALQMVQLLSTLRQMNDTLSALRHAQSLGQANTLAVCNVATSAMMRMTSSVTVRRGPSRSISSR